MNANHTGTLLLVAVLISAAVAPALVAADEQVIGRPDVNVVVPENRVSAGEETTLDVFLTNSGQIDRGGPGEFVDRVTTARNTVVSVETGNSPIDVQTQSVPVGTLPEGTTGPFSLRLTVPETVPPGTYEVPIRVRYSYTRIVSYGDGQPEFADSFSNERQRITIRVEDGPQFRIVDSRSSAQIGDRGEVALSIRNVGTEVARDSRVTLRSSSDELTFGSGSRSSDSFVGTWEPGEIKEVNYTVQASDDAIQRSYSLSAQVNYTDTDGISRTKDGLVTGITPIAEQSFSVSDVESTLRVGEEGTLSGTVTNQGPSSITSGTIELQTNNPNLNIGEPEYRIGDLAAGESTSFSFDVDVTDSANAGPRQLTATVQYRDDDNDPRTSDELDIDAPVGDDRPEFGVVPVNGTLRAGSGGQLILEVTNQNEAPVSDISAKLFVDSPISVSDDEAFIEQLGPGESATIVFGISVASSALEKSYPVELDFQYDDADGDTLVSDTYTIPVTVETQQRGGGLGVLPIVGLFVVIVAALFGVYLYRRDR